MAAERGQGRFAAFKAPAARSKPLRGVQSAFGAFKVQGTCSAFKIQYLKLKDKSRGTLSQSASIFFDCGDHLLQEGLLYVEGRFVTDPFQGLDHFLGFKQITPDSAYQNTDGTVNLGGTGTSLTFQLSA